MAKLNQILIASLILVIVVGLFVGFFLRPPPPTTTSPATTSTTSPTPTASLPSLEEIASTKQPESVPEKFLPLKLPWLLKKGQERTDMFYASGLPRVPHLVFKVNISANIGGELAEALIEGDKIFLADHQGIYALSRDNGSLIWGVEVYSDSLEGRATSSLKPVSKWKALGLWGFVQAYGLGNKLYVGTSSSRGGEGDAYLIALNKDNGELVWKVKLESEGNATSKTSVTSNLIVVGGRIFVGSVRDEGYVFCVSEDGVLQWRSKVGANVRGLAYGSDILYVYSEPTTKLYAINSKTGQVIWVFKHDEMLSTPVYKNGKIFLTDSSGKLLAISEEGKLLWKKSLGISGDVNSNSYFAVDDHYIYAVRGLGERPRNIFKLDFDGKVLGNFTMEKDEDGGRPLVSDGVVILPVMQYNKYNKVYLLWKGLFKLSEFKLGEKEEIWMPKTSAGYGEIYIVANPTTLYKFADFRKPIMGDVKVTVDGGLIINASVCDKESGLYGVYLAYSINGSNWNYKQMSISIRYLIEPVGGYGFGETLFPYDVRVEIAKGTTTVEFYVIAIDNVGNYETTKVYAYLIRK
ncbi:MAG: PQQ-binding-like beta-propeller repeat protein [Nitrososphaeria archaeon]